VNRRTQGSSPVLAHRLVETGLEAGRLRKTTHSGGALATVHRNPRPAARADRWLDPPREIAISVRVRPLRIAAETGSGSRAQRRAGLRLRPSAIRGRNGARISRDNHRARLLVRHSI
jgi:hypothetical protein